MKANSLENRRFRSHKLAIAAVQTALFALLCAAPPLRGQLLSNLQKFPDRIAVGDPLTQASENKEGPKGLATADFNGDGKPDLAVGNLDGTVTVLTSLGGGKFAAPQHLQTGTGELRSVLAADLNGDGTPDLAVASPLDGQLLVFFNPGDGQFGPATPLAGWVGVRSLAAGDFDGDGVTDIAAAGPGLGVRHFRGTGGGAFQIMGDLPRLSPVFSELPRPVYALRTLRSRDGLRDDLVVTHAESSVLWILSTVTPDRSQEPPVDVSLLPDWRSLPSPVVLHEVQVQNATTLRDADGTTQPWAELLNKSSNPVTLGGWKLKSESNSWSLPTVTILPGRMLVVFLSGKGRDTGPELHAPFLLQQNAKDLRLVQPDGSEANSLKLASHSVTDISFGLAPDRDATVYFDVPSPGAENNAGFTKLSDIGSDSLASLTIVPRDPDPGQSTAIRVTIPEHLTGISVVRNVWFSATPDLVETHHLLHRTAPGIYEVTLPPGAFTGTTPHRVLARLRDGDGNDYTTEIHRGLDEPRIVGIASPQTGRLLPVAGIPSPNVKSFEIGIVRTAAGQPGTEPDLVLVDEDRGLLRILPPTPGARRFAPIASQEVAVRGAPRDVKLADTDGDGWLDATVILRSLDLALTLKNEEGTFRATGELPTGRSPREAVIADFTGDGKPDLAVINRYSADVSILPSSASEAGFVSLDQIYAVNGEVAGLIVRDVNDDGRADVIQTHRGSSEISTRIAGQDGTLGPPSFRTMGQAPSAMASADVNGDGITDMLTANLGRSSTAGSISVLLGTGDGSYEPPQTFSAEGSMFAISVADFDNDGYQDVVAGLFDCRVAFFFGDGTGNFTYEFSRTFAYEARVMVTGDFDQDGDIDIAGAGYSGDMVTLENRGAKAPEDWAWRRYPPSNSRASGTERITLTFLDSDSDPDLVIGTGNGVRLFLGGPGMEFQSASEYALGFSVSDVLTDDLDGDGRLEMVAACRAASCINILTQNGAGEFVLSLQADVPSGRYLASGDIDGDGKPDLVGTGDVLWTVLSSRPPQSAAPETRETNRDRSSGIVLNEILSQNTGVPIAVDKGSKSDFVELYNGDTVPTDVSGWKLRLQSIQNGTPVDQTWPLPALTMPSDGHSLVIFSEESGALHTGFTLPAEGGTLTLLRPDDSEADQVSYPPALENISWSRYLDGHPSFHADRIPSPGMSNLDNGTVPPEVKLTPPSPASMVPGEPLLFTAKGRDDAGIISLSLLWNRLDAPYAEPQRLILYDDGMHEDGESLDGFFAGRMPTPLPVGAEIQFYLEAVDLSGEILLLPDTAELSGPGDPPVAWSLSLTEAPALEITEVCSNNLSLRRDENGDYPDFVTVRNTGSVPVDLDTILLAKSPLASRSSVFAFPPFLTLSAGAEITVFADNNPERGALHAPFTLDAGGDDLSLLAVRPSGARQWIHSLRLPAMPENGRFARVPGTDFRAVRIAKDESTYWSGISYNSNGTAFATATFTALPGFTYTLEGDAPGLPESWSPLGTFVGNGEVRTLTRPVTQMEALRVVAVASGSFPIRVDSVQIASNAAAVYGEGAPSASSVTLFYGTTQGFQNPDQWERSITSTGSAFAFEMPNLRPNSTYYYTIRATHSVPAATSSIENTWLGSASLTTKAAGYPTPVALELTVLNATEIGVEVRINPPAPPGSTVTLLSDTADAFANVAAWNRQTPAVPLSTNGALWFASLAGLERETEYFVRAFIEAPSGQSLSVRRLRVRTPNRQENLATNLKLSEIMYHPAPPNEAEAAVGFEEDDFEYLELHNASAEVMDLSGLWFADGIDFDFPLLGAPLLAPNGYAVIAANPHAFAMRYGASIPLAGWTLHPFRRSRLANSGEMLTLRTADGTVLFSFAYNDSPTATDGYGFSLEYRPVNSSLIGEGQLDYTDSRISSGTPGRVGIAAADLEYPAWMEITFSTEERGDPLATAPEGDFDHDGLSNFLEFFFGTDPRVPGSPDMLRIASGPIPKSVRITFPVNLRANVSDQSLQSNSLTEPFQYRLFNVEESGRVSFSYPIISVDVTLSPDGQRILYTLDCLRQLASTPNVDAPEQFYRLHITP